MERFATVAAEALSQVLKTPVQAGDLEAPPDPKLGDFGYPCFRLAKEFRKAPPLVAAQLAEDIRSSGKLPAHIQVSTAGPYVNFTVATSALLQALLKDIVGSKDPDGSPFGTYGSKAAKSRGTWVLEFSSPNVAKPLNFYHLRPTALGAALDRVGRFRGFHVISINHLGDWGTQYGMLAAAFRFFGKTVKDDLSMSELVDLYVKINAEADQDPKIKDEAREGFLKLERGDPTVTALWQKCVDVSIHEFERQYQQLNVHFDHIWGESFYKDQTKPLLEDLRRRGIMIESEGAWVVPLTDAQGKEIPPCILEKADGATIYGTRDVAAAIYRYDQFHFDRMTYIVGQEQKLHFQQVFGVLKKMGFAWAERCEHVPTGLYRFKDAKMSTRKGNFITLEEVLETVRRRVAELITERAALAKAERAEQAADASAGDGEKSGGESHAAQEVHAAMDANSPEFAQVVEAVAVGATVFHDLHADPARDVEFDLARVVDFEGETGPYLQYAHTRCLSILRKAAAAGALKGGPAPGAAPYADSLVAELQAPEELALVKVLGQFPMHLERTLSFAKASQLAHYLIDVTRAFGDFYRECRVLGERAELTSARLMLVEATRRVLGRGLSLLGVPLPEKM